MNLYAWRMGVYNNKLYVTTFDPGVVLDYAENMVSDPVQKQVVRTLIAALKAYNDNPAGFDLYSTANGVDFTPVTRDGFGDKFNYGGRTVRPAENGLYVGTANPFYGGQVWKVSDVPEGGSFGDMLALVGHKNIGEEMDKIIARLAEANNLRGVIDNAHFNDEDKLGKGQPLTVCNGITGAGVVAGRYYTPADCYKLEVGRYKEAEAFLAKSVPTYSAANVFQQAVGLDFIHNKGAGAFATSTYRRKWVAGDTVGACRENERWNRGTVRGVSVVLPGLKIRGDANSDLCANGL